MNTQIIFPSRWSTSSFGATTDTSPMELADLGEHLDRCRAAPSSLSALRYCAEILHGFVAARFVTTLLIVALLMGGGLLAL